MRQRIPTPKHTHHRALWEKATKGRAGTRWDSVVEKVWKDIGGNQEQILTTEKFAGCKTEVKEEIEIRERLALRNRVKEEENLEIYRGLREEIGMKTYMHGPKDYAKTVKLRFRAGYLDLPERRKRYASSREEELAQLCLCRKAVESTSHIVRECEIYKEERDVLEMRKIDECDYGEVWYTR